MTSTQRTHQLLALLVGVAGGRLKIVRRALAEAGIAERKARATGEGWERTEPPDVVILDAAKLDPAGTLSAATAAGRLDASVPVVVLAEEGRADTAARRAWLRAGAWDVISPGMEPELLALSLGNLVRGRPAPPDRAPEAGDPAAYRAAGDRKEPYAWRALVRVADETLALARRQRRPLTVVAFVPEGTEPPSAVPILLAERLARALLPRVRGEDLVGITEHGAILVVLPETTPEGARFMQQRMLDHLRDEVHALGMVTDLGTSMAHIGHDDLDSGDSAVRFLLRVAGRAA
jgi:DNA-binding NarL/FixJ family response regulator